MRSLTAILLFSLFVTTNVDSASAQRVEYRGTFVLTKVNQTCIDNGWFVGTTATVRFRPGGVSTNGSTGLSIFFPFFAEGYNYGGPVTDLTQGDFLDVSGAGLGSGGPYDIFAKLRLTNLKPKTIQATTNFVTAVGQFRGFDVQGCNVTFRMAANRRL